MEIDNDIDQGLLQQFSCMGTTDREVLVSQLQKVVGNHVNETAATFFLDMNNWNLQAAVCSYFDFECPNKLPSMTFIKDATVGEGESVSPGAKFTKTWHVMNSGDEAWPPGCCLRFTQGHHMCESERVVVDALQPGQLATIAVEMVSPVQPGTYQGKWRMSTATGSFFGEIIWVIVVVEEGGTLSLTQQLSQLNDLGSPVRPPTTPLPHPSLPQHPSAPSDSTPPGEALLASSFLLASSAQPLPPHNPFAPSSAVPSNPTQAALFGSPAVPYTDLARTTQECEEAQGDSPMC